MSSLEQRALNAVRRGQQNALQLADDFMSTLDSYGRTWGIIELLQRADGQLFWRILAEHWSGVDATWHIQDTLID
jgi:hypothetical protein